MFTHRIKEILTKIPFDVIEAENLSRQIYEFMANGGQLTSEEYVDWRLLTDRIIEERARLKNI